MFDLNWNAVISLKYEDDEFYLLWRYYQNGKNQITEKQKDYIKNFFISIMFQTRNTNFNTLKRN